MSGAFLLSLLVTGVAFLVGWFSLVGVRRLRQRNKIKRRLTPVVDLLTIKAKESTPIAARQPRRNRREFVIFAWLNQRYPLAGGVRVSIVSVVSGTATFLLMVPVLRFFGLSMFLCTVVGALVGSLLTWNVGKIIEGNKRSSYSDRFLIVLEDFHRMVRFGIAGNQALHSTAAAAEEPVKASLRNIVLETEFGVPMAEAMDREARRIRISELAMLAAVFSTQSSTGGNLSESIENIATTLRERLDNRSRLKSSTAESRVTMIILALVPFAGIGVQAALQPELVDALLGDARHLLGIGVAFIVAGLLISWLIIRSAHR